MSKIVLLGKGSLNWHRHERVTDRFGIISLFRSSIFRSYGLNKKSVKKVIGAKGRLVAKYKRGNKAAVLFVLGEGIAFTERKQNKLYIGVKPEGYGEEDLRWLDVDNLYRLWQKEIILYFVPTKSTCSQLLD